MLVFMHYGVCVFVCVMCLVNDGVYVCVVCVSMCVCRWFVRLCV